MLIAEELLLLALDPHTGKVLRDAQYGLPVALAGALIRELGLQGSLSVQGRRFIATGARPSHPLLAAAQQALAKPQGQTFTDQLSPVPGLMEALNPRIEMESGRHREARPEAVDSRTTDAVGVPGWARYPARPRAVGPVGEVVDPPSGAGARPEAQPGAACAKRRTGPAGQSEDDRAQVT